ncbi:uncharacterized protein ASPGLDRAFT_50037 [Aspergillus glaucus CBS 516.65]|uniref:Uncharacterized protein n=1 Tax=Aspergillus glaucus CBS 516.65 TaxID=1160497 RepID=A0A1L9VC71_ASPGL|nr:hypothetical protein ASPGLDRAFT_50037 [Aspergillus glaucus CBS 516.65]OJJ81516.1 hypothetical protein ASPGLDRAFT_50037 [Aspergillus glaucus CBS 516.65]
MTAGIIIIIITIIVGSSYEWWWWCIVIEIVRGLSRPLSSRFPVFSLFFLSLSLSLSS